MKFFCKLVFTFAVLLCGINNVHANSGQIKAKQIQYDTNYETITATGDVYIRFEEYEINADLVHYDIQNDIVYAEGNLRISDKKNNTVYGEKAIFKDRFKKGIIEEFIAKLDKDSVLVSRFARRLDTDHVQLEKTAFTSCQFNCNKNPIWQIKAKETNIDYTKQKLVYRNVFFEVYGVPVIFLPYFSHPVPQADGQSGVLAPKIKNNDFLVPFYFRPKSNMDATISPRLSKNYTIFETEFRHKLESGDYQILGSFGDPPISKTKNADIAKNRPGRYHIFAKGDFNFNRLNYGFDLKRTSDKAYLVNYHNIFDSYLTSSFYVREVDHSNYVNLESFYFQDMRSSSTKKREPLVFPSIKTKNVLSLNEDETTLLNISSKTIAYRELSEFQLFRTSVNLALTNLFITDTGHIIDTSLSNRGDLYWVDSLGNVNLPEKAKIWYRNIPEISNRIRYPLVKSINEDASLKFEPTAMLTVGRRYEERFSKFGLVDQNKLELSDANLFLANRYGGVDFHEYGTRFTYGGNMAMHYGSSYYQLFLGQLIEKNNVINKVKNVDIGNLENHHYVGNLSYAFSNNFELFYSFRRDKKLKPVRNETGMIYSYDKVSSRLNYSEIYNIPKYFAHEEFEPDKNKRKQIRFDISYRLTPTVTVGTGARLDLSPSKTSILSRTIRVTYHFDCVSIDGTITDNYLHNSLSGVKKVRTKTFALGLKAINM